MVTLLLAFKRLSIEMDRFTQYAMVASDEAIADSKLDLDKINKLKVGVIWGAGIGGLETFQNEVLNFAGGDGSPRFNPFFIPKMIADNVSILPEAVPLSDSSLRLPNGFVETSVIEGKADSLNSQLAHSA